MRIEFDRVIPRKTIVVSAWVVALFIRVDESVLVHGIHGVLAQKPCFMVDDPYVYKQQACRRGDQMIIVLWKISMHVFTRSQAIAFYSRLSFS